MENRHPEPNAQPIQIEIYGPNPDKPGYLKRLRTRSYREVFDDLEAGLQAAEMVDEYISLNCRNDDPHQQAPIASYRWISVYAVRGDSEGYYIHIDFIRQDAQSSRIVESFAMIKTCGNFDRGWEIAKHAAFLLDA